MSALPQSDTPRKVILDCDPGIDDAFAIAFGCGHPGLELRGVTTVAGNVGLDKTTTNALAVLEFLGRKDVPVAAGSPAPLLRTFTDAHDVHGETGLGAARLPAPSGRPSWPPRHGDGMSLGDIYKSLTQGAEQRAIGNAQKQYAKGELQKAIETLKEAHDKSPENSDVLFEMARMLILANRGPEASDALRTSSIISLTFG